jgi:hypothetical protein
MSVALIIRHAIRVNHIVICGLFGPTIIFHITSYMVEFFEQNSEYKMCALTFTKKFIWDISHWKKKLCEI